MSKKMKHLYLFSVLLIIICYYGECAEETADDSSYVFQNENIANGEYSFRFKTPNNIEREESGSLDGNEDLVVRGYYSYIDETTGVKYYVSYYADKTGYHPSSEPSSVKPDFPPITAISGSISSGALASLLG